MNRIFYILGLLLVLSSCSTDLYVDEEYKYCSTCGNGIDPFGPGVDTVVVIKESKGDYTSYTMNGEVKSMRTNELNNKIYLENGDNIGFEDFTDTAFLVVILIIFFVIFIL